MSILNTLRATFRYRKTNVSICILVAYSLVALLYVSDQIRYKYPSPNDKSLIKTHLDKSWMDLQNITFSYHPYTSRDNDRVHDYLLERINDIVETRPFATVSDDMADKSSSIFKQTDTFNASSTKSRVIYFESSNVVVKLTGKNSQLPGLLLSAHFDSVPTSHGATDDGKGIVSLLALLDYYSKNQPERTLVFNFNNDEEFGLLGATHFLNHKWSKLVNYFLNLEGAGTGSKSVLLRTSDISTARIYRDAVKVEPFGNSIFQQGFNQRQIRSETDYKVYSASGLRGWDIAFFKPRDLYHTGNDDVKHTSKEALWHMLHTSWQLTEYMNTFTEDANFNTSPAIYFDFAGLKFYACSAKSLFAINCILLVLVPIVLIPFHTLTNSRHQLNEAGLLLWLRLPLTFIIAIGVLTVTELFLYDVNRFVVFRDYISPLLMFASEFLLINIILLSVLEYFWPSRLMKDITLLQLNFVVWGMLLYATYLLRTTDYGTTGIYIVTMLFVSLSGALFIKYLASLISPPGYKKTAVRDNSPDGSIVPAPMQTASANPAVNEQPNNLEGRQNSVSVSDSGDDERAPLLPFSSSRTEGTEILVPPASAAEGGLVKDTQYEWIFQFIILIPVLVLLFQNLVEVLSALSQTVVESRTSMQLVWNTLFGGAVILCFTTLPFLKVGFKMTAALLFVFAGLLVRTIILSPFTGEVPLKIRFSQNLNGNVEVTGVGSNLGFLEDVLVDMPSVKQRAEQVHCSKETQTCSYQGLKSNLVNCDSQGEEQQMMSIEVLQNDHKNENRSKYAPMNAEIKIHSKENRACTLYFNNTFGSSSLVKEVTVYLNVNKTNSTKFRWHKGIDELQLHKLDFGKEFYHIGIEWFPKIISGYADAGTKPDEDVLGIVAMCYWGEFDSTTMCNGESRRMVPAYDELLEYSPIHYTFTNRDKGLVYGKQYVEL